MKSLTDTFAGRPIADVDGRNFRRSPKKYTPRLCLGYQEDRPPAEILADFTARPTAAHLRALVIGPWDYDTMYSRSRGNDAEVSAVIAAASRLPALRHLYFGHIESQECEISWIVQSNLTPLLDAYPLLEEFRVRGTTSLSFAGPLRHTALRSLAIESGGLNVDVLADVFAAELPALEHLELWLGSPRYHGIADADPLRPLLAGDLFPRLRSLGLRNSHRADAVAAAVAVSPLLGRVKVLDLSMGNLSDDGIAALLASPHLAGLERLDIRHHYATTSAVAALRERVAVVVEDAKDPQKVSRYTSQGREFVERYNVVSE